MIPQGSDEQSADVQIEMLVPSVLLDQPGYAVAVVGEAITYRITNPEMPLEAAGFRGELDDEQIERLKHGHSIFSLLISPVLARWLELLEGELSQERFQGIQPRRTDVLRINSALDFIRTTEPIDRSVLDTRQDREFIVTGMAVLSVLDQRLDWRTAYSGKSARPKTETEIA